MKVQATKARLRSAQSPAVVLGLCRTVQPKRRALSVKPSAVMATALKPVLTAAELAAPKSTVCVTGAAGYVASAVVQRLLASGHTG